MPGSKKQATSAFCRDKNVEQRLQHGSLPSQSILTECYRRRTTRRRRSRPVTTIMTLISGPTTTIILNLYHTRYYYYCMFIRTSNSLMRCNYRLVTVKPRKSNLSHRLNSTRRSVESKREIWHPSCASGAAQTVFSITRMIGTRSTRKLWEEEFWLVIETLK